VSTPQDTSRIGRRIGTGARAEGVAALWLSDRTMLAAIFGAVGTIHLVLTFVLGQR
jgi:hypothetical protein